VSRDQLTCRAEISANVIRRCLYILKTISLSLTVPSSCIDATTLANNIVSLVYIRVAPSQSQESSNALPNTRPYKSVGLILI
jgi:hypothetical protein